ncbi:MAG: bifunctional diguanylate cyclase/phosphodiesterase [Proteobacteria bacterium]|nr:bifunctional diguanylate cyclase/phosphodiesterase [Pseudomonadota bacterium]MBS0495086.1 bifunctional diguanylate cyclase/phosphodiesterase [Pseudomonadota bacterium]
MPLGVDSKTIEDHASAELTRWTAVLADPQQEQAFRKSTFGVERITMRVAALVVFVVDIFALIAGKLIAGHPTTTSEIVVQSASLTAVMLLYWALGRQQLRHWRIWAIASGLILSLVIAVLIAFGHDMAYRGGMLIPSGILVAYLVVRLDLATLIWLSTAYSVMTFVAWLSILETVKVVEVSFLFALMLVGHALGYFESRRLQRERRMVFVQKMALTQHATIDDLTGLSNRRYFNDVVDAQLSALHTQREAAVMLVDLDRFKEINDTLGHHTGDILLQQIACRMRRALPGAFALARFGGDEFAALFVGPPGHDWATTEIRRFLSSLDEPFELEGLALYIHASIGLAICRSGEDRQTLLRQSDIAMYRAKLRGGGVEVYSLKEISHTREHVELASDLNTALENDEIRLYYQPKTDIATGETHGTEALIRWQHPVHGLLSPARFLPIAERHGLMRKLTLRVFELALQQAQGWHSAGRHLRIAVNLAQESLLDENFPDEVLGLLARTKVPAEMLLLEITENTILVDPDRMLRVITRLGKAGFKFALDDYGTGYSSLSYLSVLPLEELKIDRSFVSDFVTVASKAVIVRSTIQMARELGFHVVAEGVEDLATWQELSRFGCDTAQGYYLLRPVPAEELEDWIDCRASVRPQCSVGSALQWQQCS